MCSGAGHFSAGAGSLLQLLPLCSAQKTLLHSLWAACSNGGAVGIMGCVDQWAALHGLKDHNMRPGYLHGGWSPWGWLLQAFP